VEVILQLFRHNIPENLGATDTDGMIVHLVNLTGFSGNTYFDPLPVFDTQFTIACDFKPRAVWSMVSGEPVDFAWGDGTVKFAVKKLGAFDGVVVER